MIGINVRRRSLLVVVLVLVVIHVEVYTKETKVGESSASHSVT